MKEQRDMQSCYDTHDLEAGCFSSWLRRIRYTLLKNGEAAVNCGQCSACCTSSYFIHIGPEETDTLSRIDRRLLFPAPAQPRGTKVMGYSESGRCPMHSGGRCTIYDNRPGICRMYDCRIFTAAGIEAGGGDKALINEQVARWRFSYPTGRDSELHRAVKAAAGFISRNRRCFPSGQIPDSPSQLAILALKVYEVFLGRGGGTERDDCEEYCIDTAGRILNANEKFEALRETLSQKPLPLHGGIKRRKLRRK